MIARDSTKDKEDENLAAAISSDYICPRVMRVRDQYYTQSQGHVRDLQGQWRI